MLTKQSKVNKKEFQRVAKLNTEEMFGVFEMKK